MNAEREAKYAKEIALACGYIDPMRQHKIGARAAMVVADAEQAELRANVARVEALLDEWRTEDANDLPTGDRADELRAALDGTR